LCQDHLSPTLAIGKENAHERDPLPPRRGGVSGSMTAFDPEAVRAFEQAGIRP
jgi:hypothetical protein